MSGRARVFVEFWISEFVRPETREDDARCVSRVNALACLKSAVLNGISKPEVEEEFADLVTYMARRHRQIVEAELNRDLKPDDWRIRAALFARQDLSRSIH